MATQSPIERNGNIIAIAKHPSLTSEEKLSALEEIANEEIDTFDAVNLSTLAYNVGIIWKRVKNRQERESIRSIVDKHLDRITSNAQLRIAQFNPRALANTAWAFATVGRSDERLFDAVASETPLKIAQFNPQDLANSAWAFATVGLADKCLFDAIASEAPLKIAQFKPQDLANTTWAFATVGRVDKQLFDAVASEAPRKIAQFNPQELANTAWAYATVGQEDKRLFDAIASEAPKKIGHFNSQELANTAWAFAKVGRSDKRLFDAVAWEAPRKMAQFNPQNLANTAWAFATVGRTDKELFDAVASEAPRKMVQFTPKALANTAWAFATVGRADTPLFDAIALEVAQQITWFNPQDLANTAWSLALIDGKSYLVAIRHILRQADCVVTSFADIELATLANSAILSGVEMSSNFDARVKAHFEQVRSSQRPEAHNWEKQCAKLVGQMKLLFKQQAPVRGYFLDFVVHYNGSRVNLELDGDDYHYVGNGPSATLKGLDAFRDLVVRHEGYKVARIRYSQWRTGDPKELILEALRRAS